MSKQRARSTASLAERPVTPERAAELAQTFKAIADPVRLRLFSLIASHPDGEVCVCDLTEAFDLTGPTISHHLKVLRNAGLIDSERRRTWVYYRALPGTLAQLSAALAPSVSTAAAS